MEIGPKCAQSDCGFDVAEPFQPPGPLCPDWTSVIVKDTSHCYQGAAYSTSAAAVCAEGRCHAVWEDCGGRCHARHLVGQLSGSGLRCFSVPLSQPGSRLCDGTCATRLIGWSLDPGSSRAEPEYVLHLITKPQFSQSQTGRTKINLKMEESCPELCAL